MNILCTGLSHQTATVEQRERFAIPDADLGAAAARLGRLPGLTEAVIVSTCNRVEFYAASDDASVGMDSLREFVQGRTHSQAGASLSMPGRMGCGTFSGWSRVLNRW